MIITENLSELAFWYKLKQKRLRRLLCVVGNSPLIVRARTQTSGTPFDFFIFIAH
jgi:hypothetical protein